MIALISNYDFIRFYFDNSALIDFLILFAFFTSIARLSLIKSFKHDPRSLNLLTVAIGLALSISIVLWESQYHLQLFFILFRLIIY
jgi:hypothetical protein